MSNEVVTAENRDLSANEGRVHIIYTPRVDIVEQTDTIVLWADMPGVSPDAVDITLEKNILRLSGAMDEHPANGYEVVHREKRPGVYRRQFTLSDGIDRNNIEATMKDGVLKLTLHKSEALKTRRITVAAAE